MNIAIILARGGSKRIPRKNIKLFSGRPIIEYPIMTAKRSGLFDRVIVSTDDTEIAQVAAAAGAEVPFERPAALADDYTPTADVVAHAIKTLNKAGPTIKHACCIYATTPFLKEQYLREGFQTLTTTDAGCVFSVTTFDFPIYRALKIDSEGQVGMVWPEHELTRSNDLSAAYHDAGQFYWVKASTFLQTPRLYSPGARAVIIPRYLAQDIDTPEDWETAQRLYAANQCVDS